MAQKFATAQVKRISLVLCSLILSLWHFGPLQGSLLSLLLTVGGQVYLFGYLVAHALGLFRESESIVIRLIWIVTCGLCINIVLGAGARLLLVPVNAYVIGLHLLMILLSLTTSAVAPILKIDHKVAPVYLLLIVVCILFILVGWERNRLWLDGYEDQSLPVSLADWWAHQSNPENLVSRQIAETNTLSYWSSDGVTYILATWVWTGGFSAVQLIWYALTPLFVWLVPLAHYALAYRVTKRADTAAWATGFVLLLALTTISGSFPYAGAWNFGQEAAFQLDTLRTFSTALLLPLVLFVFMTCLRSPRVKYYLLTGVVILALALTHPRQFLALFTGLYAILAVSWLVMPSRVRLRQALLLGLAMLPSLLIPLWQYTSKVVDTLQPVLLTDLAATVGTTEEIIEPSTLLFNPLVSLALILSLAALVRLRRSLAAQFIFSMTAVMLILSYVPPIFNSILRIFGSYFGLHFVLELFFIVPYGLILGITVSFLHDQLLQRVRAGGSAGHWILAGGFAAAALVLLVEPFPIANSARDQLDSAYQAQVYRDIHPFDEALLNRLQSLSVTQDKVVYLTSNRLANYVIESVPNAFITGGRSETNPAITGSMRFFESPAAPWLDSQDIAFLQQYHVDYLILSADNSRIPQLLLQPERFESIDTVSGYLIFHVRQLNAASTLDRDFAQMNTLYATDPNPRWGVNGFDFQHEARPDLWQGMVTEWQRQLTGDPTNDLARYGLAFAQLMAGDSQVDLWATLSEAHPEIFLATNAQAQLLLEQGQGAAAATLLLAKLNRTGASEDVLSARELLTEAFFHRLTPEQLDNILALENSDSTAWSQLMEWANANKLKTDHGILAANANQIRMRAALLVSVGRSDLAASWLSRIPQIVNTPS